MLDEDRSWFLSLEHQHFSRDRKGLQAVDKWVFFVWGGAVIRDSSLIKVLFCLGFPYGSAGKESAAMRETWVRSLGWENPLEKGKELQYSGLENSMGCIVHGITKNWTLLSGFHFIHT